MVVADPHQGENFSVRYSLPATARTVDDIGSRPATLIPAITAHCQKAAQLCWSYTETRRKSSILSSEGCESGKLTHCVGTDERRQLAGIFALL